MRCKKMICLCDRESGTIAIGGLKGKRSFQLDNVDLWVRMQVTSFAILLSFEFKWPLLSVFHGMNCFAYAWMMNEMNSYHGQTKVGIPATTATAAVAAYTQRNKKQFQLE